MLFAIDKDGIKVAPVKGGRAYCPACNTVVYARCGPTNVDHWAHDSVDTCDDWSYEPKTFWHINWQSRFHKDDIEVIIKKENKFHIADIIATNDVVIEIQNSPISADEILARESFYGKMIWILNARHFAANLDIVGFSHDIDMGVVGSLIEYERNSQGFAQRIRLTVPSDDDMTIENCLRADPWLYTEDEQQEGLWYVNNPNMLTSEQLPTDLMSAYIAYGLGYKFMERIEDESKSRVVNFQWRHMRRSWLVARQPIFFDISPSYLLWVTEHDYKNYFSGKVISKRRFLDKYRKRLPDFGQAGSGVE